MEVIVRENSIEQALRTLKKKMQREGVYRKMRQCMYYEKPSEEYNRKKKEAIGRIRKAQKKYENA